MDKNILALIDDNAVTVDCSFANSDKTYRYIYHKHEGWPKPFVGQLLVVPAKYGISLGDAIIPANSTCCAIVIVHDVHDCVDIEPNDPIKYSYVIQPVNLSTWCIHNESLAIAEKQLQMAYKAHLRKSFKNALLENAPEEVKALLSSIKL